MRLSEIGPQPLEFQSNSLRPERPWVYKRPSERDVLLEDRRRMSDANESTDQGWRNSVRCGRAFTRRCGTLPAGPPRYSGRVGRGEVGEGLRYSRRVRARRDANGFALRGRRQGGAECVAAAQSPAISARDP